MTHLERLATLEDAVKAATDLEATRRREMAERTRSLTTLKAQRLDYEREVGGGAERDPEDEREVDAAFRDPSVESGAALPYGRTPYVELVDLAAEARVAGAVEAWGLAEQERDRYCRHHVEALLAELAADDPDRTGVIRERLVELDELLRAQDAVRLRADQVLRRAGRRSEVELTDDTLVEDLLRAVQRPLRAGDAALRLLPEPSLDSESAA